MSTEIETYKSLLTSSWSEVPVNPGFAFFPKGCYVVKVQSVNIKDVQTKKGEDTLQLNVTVELVEVTQLANEDDTPPAAGSLGYFSFWGVRGLSDFGKVFRSVIDSLESPTPEATIQALTGLELQISTKVRVDRKNLDDAGNPNQYSELELAILL